MIQASTIEKKLEEFFLTKTNLRERVGLNELALLVSHSFSAAETGPKFNYSLYKNNELNCAVTLAEVLHLTMLEKMIVKEEMVEEILQKAINDFALKEQKQRLTISLLFKGNKTYFFIVDNKETKVELNQIIL